MTSTNPRVPADPAHAAHWWRWFLGVFAVLYVLPFFLIRAPHFEAWGGSNFGPALDYSFNLSHKDADIVLFGDSTAVTGINPRLLSSQLGLSVVNLPNTGASLHVVSDMALQHYLATNKPPRLIVFYFSPWELNYSHEPAGGFVYEGEEVLAIHGSPREIAAFVRQYPAMALRFPIYFYAANITTVAHAVLHGGRTADESRNSADYTFPNVRSQALTSPCEISPSRAEQTGDDTARTLLTRYRTPQSDVLLYLAPIPACSNAATVAARTYVGLTPAPPTILPAPFFSDDLNFDHPLAHNVPQATGLLAQAVRQRLQLPPPR